MGVWPKRCNVNKSTLDPAPCLKLGKFEHLVGGTFQLNKFLREFRYLSSGAEDFFTHFYEIDEANEKGGPFFGQLRRLRAVPRRDMGRRIRLDPFPYRRRKRIWIRRRV